MPDVILRCEHLTKSFGARVAVDDVTFHVAPGETYGLLGPNGAGKTTTISIISGLLDADTGQAVVAGTVMNRRAVKARAAIGVVPQEVALWGGMTARENLEFFGHLYGLGGRALRQRVTEVLEIVRLSDRADERIGEYSGGMKRRANIAAGLIHQPQLLLLDEPTVGVDPQSRNAILEALAKLAEGGLAVLFASHYMAEVERLCQRVGILDDGHLIAEGKPSDLVASLERRRTVELSTNGPLDLLARECERFAGVGDVQVLEDAVHVQSEDPAKLLSLLLASSEDSGVMVTGFHVVEPDLETVFLRLTGKALRD